LDLPIAKLNVMEKASHRFILQAIDPDLGCPVFETMLRLASLDDLLALLGLDHGDDLELRGQYVIDAAELATICERFCVLFDPEGREVRLDPWHSLREVPYLVHTNYELPLLLEGRKQLARVYEQYPPHQHHDEERFDRFVAAGLLHKEVSLHPFGSPRRLADGSLTEGIREVCYARKGQEWRIQAWKLISAASRATGWNESFERLEGMLYGYEDWQMEWWIAHRYGYSPSTAIAPSRAPGEE
jgi:hypothetical protein